MARQKDKRSITHTAVAAVCVFLTGIILSLMVTDLEKSARLSEKEKVSAAVTFSPPEKQEEKGFWDIFFDSVSYMLSGGI